MQNNIVYWKESGLLSGSWSDPHVALDHNLYWNASGKPVDFAGKSLAEWQAADKDLGSIVADPQFLDPAHGGFRLKPTSPALKLGFKPFDYRRAGVYGGDYWMRLARQGSYPAVEFAPEPPPAPPLKVQLDFERVPVGATCPEAQNNVEGKGDAIAVTEETAFAGKRSLKVQDAPGLQAAFNPHLVFSPNHREGIATMRFAMRAEAGVNMYHEWRDWQQEPYRVGPSFWLRGTSLTVAGREVAQIPQGVWVSYIVRAGIGPDQNGVWELTLSVPGARERGFKNLPLVSRDFRALTWCGFSSMATERTVFYLDEIALVNEKW